MTVHLFSAPAFEFEAFGTAVALAVVCGALSTVLPLFVAPTATLAALALAGWVSLSRERGTLSRAAIGRPSVIAFGVLIVGAAGFLDPPGPLLPFRGLLLAVGLLPLFVIERLRFPRRSPDFGTR
jgi:hypothetical protein